MNNNIFKNYIKELRTFEGLYMIDFNIQGHFKDFSKLIKFKDISIFPRTFQGHFKIVVTLNFRLICKTLAKADNHWII